MISVSCFIVTNPLLLDLRGFSMTPGSDKTVYPRTVDVRYNGNPKQPANIQVWPSTTYPLDLGPPRKSHSRPQPMTR